MTTRDDFEIAEENQGEDLRLVLRAEGQLMATAVAPADVIAQMQAQRSMTRDELRAELEEALRKLHHNMLDKVTIQHLKQEPPNSLHFTASYIFRDFKNISIGTVWYDLQNGTTGPDDVPALVRNKMRYEANIQLAKGDENVEALLRAIQ